MRSEFFKSIGNSLNGLRMAWKEDHSFRNALYQLGAGIVLATTLTYLFSLNVYLWLVLVASLFPVLIVETINTSIEAVTDKASPERSRLAKKAKDIGSASVLLSRLLALLCWLVVIIAALDNR